MTTRTPRDPDRMPLREHLRELRNRLLKAVGAILLVTVAAALFHRQLIGFLIDPLPGCAPGRLTGASGADGAGHCGVISSTVSSRRSPSRSRCRSPREWSARARCGSTSCGPSSRRDCTAASGSTPWPSSGRASPCS